jgi:hypothetical protein
MPPLILKGNRHPVPSYYSQSHSDWKKADKYRGYKASDFAAGNKATNELPTSNRPATQNWRRIWRQRFWKRFWLRRCRPSGFWIAWHSDASISLQHSITTGRECVAVSVEAASMSSWPASVIRQSKTIPARSLGAGRSRTVSADDDLRSKFRDVGGSRQRGLKRII